MRTLGRMVQAHFTAAHSFQSTWSHEIISFEGHEIDVHIQLSKNHTTWAIRQTTFKAQIRPVQRHRQWPYQRLLMVHPRRRDGSGLRRTPALVGLHHPPARRCRPLPSPAIASILLSPPCRRPGDGYRAYPRLETPESVKLSEVLELGLPPKKIGDVASDDKTPKTQNAALRSLALASHPPLSN